MTSKEIRRKYIQFFCNKGHVEIAPSPLVLENDSTTLFTSAGMQPLIPYLKGKPHSRGKRLVNSQPSIRLQDIEEVGDNRHTTFFEMLGNWSLGDYFKREQLPWCWEFLTKKLAIPSARLAVSVSGGGYGILKDEESTNLWKKIGVPENRIYSYPIGEENWWSRSGSPDKMPEGEIGGPDSEVFYEFDTPHDIKYGKLCHPNCGCGRFLEIGNSVFIQYIKDKNGLLSELPQKNVDFGGGLERITAAVCDNSDIFQIDIFRPIIKAIETETSTRYGVSKEKDRSFRIIADHIRASCAILAEGVVPSNKLQGYVARRLIRKAMFHLRLLGSGVSGGALAHIGESLKENYPSVLERWEEIEKNISGEGVRFGEALDRGLAKLKKAVDGGMKVDGKFAFNLYQTEGFPLELTVEILKKNGQDVSESEIGVFEKEFGRHKNLSRSAAVGMFKGGLGGPSEIITKFHTATHLLHASLRVILGEHVLQKGSNITSERLRFDFSHQQKLTDEQIKKVELLVNEQIKKDLPVSYEEKDLQDARKEGALAFFGEKYREKVKVYTIGDPGGKWFSKEVCGGPHVSKTGEIGYVRIKKQEKIGAGIIRLYVSG